MLCNQIFLVMKVQKHFQAKNFSKAAMYFAALLQEQGPPTEGASVKILAELKALGFKFSMSPCGDIAAVTPIGVVYSGKEVLAAWNAA
jgi:hypothetical protein